MIDPSIGAGQTISDAAIRAFLAKDIASGFVPPPDANRLYVVYTQPDVIVTAGGSNSQSGFYGYHDDFSGGTGPQIIYGVIANPMGTGTLAGRTGIQTLTKTTAHEVAEAVTSPGIGGWYQDGTNNEIGDLAGNLDGIDHGYDVQALWSQQYGTFVLPAGSQPLGVGITVEGPGSPTTPPPLSPQDVAAAIAGSAEADQLFVTAAYQKDLGRAADTAGLAFWTAQMEQGVSKEQLEANFIGSNKSSREHGGTIAAWMAGLYQDLLGRKPGPNEMGYWVSQVSIGASPVQVAFSFAASPEREQLQVREDYTTYLGRRRQSGRGQLLGRTISGWGQQRNGGGRCGRVRGVFRRSTERRRQSHESGLPASIETCCIGRLAAASKATGRG